VRFAQRMAWRRSTVCTPVRYCRCLGLDRRSCRSHASCPRRWRALTSWEAHREVVRHASSAPRMGMWLFDGRTNLYVALRRPVYAGRRWSSASHRVGYSCAERGLPSPDGLLLPHEERTWDAGAASLDTSLYPRMHARQRMAWRWASTAARARRFAIDMSGCPTSGFRGTGQIRKSGSRGVAAGRRQTGRDHARIATRDDRFYEP
jgi:hypothetical protein